MPLSSFRLAWLRTDAAVVILAALAILAAQAVTLLVITARWPAEDVAFYAANRRWASVAQPFITLGTLTLIPSWLAQARLGPSTARSLCGVLLLGGGAVMGTMQLAPALMGRVLFGVASLPPEARWATSAVFLGHASLGLALAALQGLGLLRSYALGFAGTYAVIPVVAALWAPGWVAEALAVAGAWVLIATALLWRYWSDVTRVSPHTTPAGVWAGWRRIPGDLGVPILLTAPAVFVGQEMGAVAAGQLAWVGIGMAGLGTVVAAGHLTITRYAASVVAHGRHEMAHRQAHRTIRRVRRSAWVATAGCLAAWALYAERHGVPSTMRVAQALQIASLAPYLVQLVARRFVDGLEERPLALRPIAWGMVAGVVWGWSVSPHFGAAVAGTSGVLLAYLMMSTGMTRLAEGSAVPYPWLRAWEPGARRVARTLGAGVLRPVMWTRGLLRSD